MPRGATGLEPKNGYGHHALKYVLARRLDQQLKDDAEVPEAEQPALLGKGRFWVDEQQKMAEKTQSARPMTPISATPARDGTCELMGAAGRLALPG